MQKGCIYKFREHNKDFFNLPVPEYVFVNSIFHKLIDDTVLTYYSYQILDINSLNVIDLEQRGDIMIARSFHKCFKLYMTSEDIDKRFKTFQITIDNI